MCQPVGHPARGSRQGRARRASGRAASSLSSAVSIDFGWRWLRGLERSQHPGANRRRNRLQRSDQVGQKACGVAIPLVQRQPGGRSRTPGDPCADQRGFAKASGGRNERQLAVQARVQPLQQARAENRVRSRWRAIQFRGKQVRRHSPSIAHAPSTTSLQGARQSFVGIAARMRKFPVRPWWITLAHKTLTGTRACRRESVAPRVRQNVAGLPTVFQLRSPRPAPAVCGLRRRAPPGCVTLNC